MSIRYIFGDIFFGIFFSPGVFPSLLPLCVCVKDTQNLLEGIAHIEGVTLDKDLRDHCSNVQF